MIGPVQGGMDDIDIIFFNETHQKQQVSNPFHRDTKILYVHQKHGIGYKPLFAPANDHHTMAMPAKGIHLVEEKPLGAVLVVLRYYHQYVHK